jgi:serine/threonine-protein kinase
MIGTLIKEQYQVIELLGEGGMGEVYKALDVELDRQVALKFLKTEYCADKSLLQRFRDELKVLAGFNHANITTLYTTITWEGRPVMVMELVEGETLHRIISRRGPIPAHMAVPLIKQALAGVAVAHRKRIIHRDLKPANLMLNYDGIVKVMDFGIAKMQDAPGLTRSNTAIGTCLYMAPEQIRGMADARTDIYAMGITLYELLAGRVPFQGASEYDIQTAHIQQVPEPPSVFYPHIPGSIVEAVMRSLEKDPAARFQTAEEFSEALGSGYAHESVVPGLSEPRLAEPPTDTPEPYSQPPRNHITHPPSQLVTAAPAIPLAMAGTQARVPPRGTVVPHSHAESFSSQPEWPSQVVPPAPRPKPFLLWGALAAGILLLAAVGGYWIYTRSQPAVHEPSYQAGNTARPGPSAQDNLPHALQPETSENPQESTSPPTQPKPADHPQVKTAPQNQAATPAVSNPMTGRWSGNYVRCEDDSRTPAILEIRQAAPGIVNGTIALSTPGGAARCALNGKLMESGKSVQFSVSACTGAAAPAFLGHPHTSLLSLAGGKLSGDVNPQTDVCETAEFRKM